jgi:RimJ/RimL family protein N-acetyltransferase
MSTPPILAHQAKSASQNTLSDGVISLAPFELADATTVMQWDADSDIQHWFDWPLMPPAADAATSAARLLSAQQTVRAKWALWDASEEFAFIIRSVETGQGMGWIDLQPRGSGRGNIGYGVLPGKRRMGAATRGVMLASRYAFDVLGWFRLEICTIADNVASAAVARKAGFQLDGVLRSYGAFEKHQPFLGQRFDWAIYSRLRTDK